MLFTIFFFSKSSGNSIQVSRYQSSNRTEFWQGIVWHVSMWMFILFRLAIYYWYLWLEWNFCSLAIVSSHTASSVIHLVPFIQLLVLNVLASLFLVYYRNSLLAYLINHLAIFYINSKLWGSKKNFIPMSMPLTSFEVLNLWMYKLLHFISYFCLFFCGLCAI